MKHDVSMSAHITHAFMLWDVVPIVLSLKKKTRDSGIQASVSPSLCEDAVSCLWLPLPISYFSWLLRGHHSDFFISLRNKHAVFFFLSLVFTNSSLILFFKAIFYLHPQDDNHCILFSVSKQIALAVSCIIWILYSKKEWFVVNTLYCNIYYFYSIQY